MNNKFQKRKNFLVCVDSDGCAMDTMNIKHERYFGPLIIEVFNIKDKERFLKYWNQINLYSRTRGINRFKGLVMGLKNAIQNGEEIGNIDNLIKWSETTKELSNLSIEKEIEKTPTDDLKKALEWSKKVNVGIEELVGVDKPFEKVRESLEKIHQFADIAIVSSANSEAVLSEWERHKLLPYVDVFYGQEAGTKAACIEQLKKYGYNNDEIVMIGDAPGDLDAAQKNNVLYYPILFGKEKFSWERFINEALDKFMSKNYIGQYQDKMIKEFNDLLDA
ncbi:MAG: HAD family hydrolase [Fusobacteriaceae bacterium]|nr:HAD family hydrolase [Fusobacteriaceae bacterium]MBN2839270.1 HAD family hydrolase [Fusobacteriaceae bacterium]